MPISLFFCPFSACAARKKGKGKSPTNRSTVRFVWLFVLARPEGSWTLLFAGEGSAQPIGYVTAKSCTFACGKSGGFSAYLPTERSKKDTTKVVSFLLGPPGGIRTPGLWNRNPLRYPASPRADMVCLSNTKRIIHHFSANGKRKMRDRRKNRSRRAAFSFPARGTRTRR